MNVKSIDIARALGISKSTVSLALNGKPGVSEQTRQEVLACKKQLEEHGVVPPGMFSRQPEQRKRQQIKIVKITNGMKNIQGAELDLWTDVNQVFEKKSASKWIFAWITVCRFQGGRSVPHDCRM